jgi:osmotically-inducible protein OsmY
MNACKHGLSVLVVALTMMTATTMAGAADRSVGEAVSDAEITAKVKTKLLADKRTDGLKIDVDTQSGVVYLSGQVKSADERKTAETLAKEINGVSSVENNLQVKSTN